MNKRKKKDLESKGYKVESVEFLGLAVIELKVNMKCRSKSLVGSAPMVLNNTIFTGRA